MYTIYEDDFEQTAMPSMDSDGKVELFWDHPSFPQKWTGRHGPYPYDADNWGPLLPFTEGSRFDVWGPYDILLLHFGLYRYRNNIPSHEILKRSPDELKALSALPPEILQQGMQAIEEYQRQLEQPTTKQNEAKLILVGQGGVGKTCLATRLVHDRFETQTSTEGVDILSWSITSPIDEGEEIKLNVWDFGGQEIYHATHQFFLTKRSVYLLVWNAIKSKDYEHLYFWLNTIETFGADSPIILVMTKCNIRDDDLNMKDLRERFPQIVGLYKVDSEDGTGIQALREAIRKTTCELPHMGTQWNNRWHNVRKVLESDKRFWIDHSEYQRVCFDAGLEAEQANVLDGFLHDLGVIIHFRDDLYLRNLVVLKPNWVTKAVYGVLDSPVVSSCEGVLSYRELDTIWNARDYPAYIFPSLLKLMSKFELAYELPNQTSHLVAELLPSTEPDFSWNSEENLLFYYNYDFLPAGVITRLIVLAHPYLALRIKDRHMCWRDGCILEWDSSQALVRAKRFEKQIEIRVRGRKKRELLAIIRHYLEHINRSINKAKITQQIPCNCSEACHHQFNYEQLLDAESKGREFVDCPQTWIPVSLSKLLNGYESKEKRIEYLDKQRLDSTSEQQSVSILFLAADPTDALRLRLGEEFREIQENLRLSLLRERFRLALPQLSIRPRDISQVLLDVQPQIVHFSGHGAGTGALCFENELGETHLISPDAASALFRQFAHQVNCVLLNACYSEIQARAIAQHIEYVIGMRKEITDKAAIAFTIGFYQAIGAGRTIDDAFSLGCVQIRLQNIPDDLIPVLIKRQI